MSRKALRRGKPAPGKFAIDLLEDRCLPASGLVSGLADIGPKWFEVLAKRPTDNEVQPLSQRNEWIVRLTDAASARLNSLHDVAGMLGSAVFDTRVLNGLGRRGSILLETTGGSDEQVESWLRRNPNVERFSLNQLAKIDQAPNDPRYSEMYGLNNTGQTGGINDADVDAPEGWNISTGSRNTVVGIIDTGIDYFHPDLAANMWQNPGETADNGLDDDGNGFIDDIYGYDFADGDSDPFDDQDHGTHTAGTVGAVGNNSLGVTGINWNVQLMAVRVLGSSGSGSWASIIAGVRYTTMMKQQFGVNLVVTNNSYGGYFPDLELQDAIEENGQAGLLFVAAAGNDANDNDTFPAFPCSFELDNIIAVAGTDSSDNTYDFTNFGVNAVDVAAPAVDVLSTIPNGQYAAFTGTSMASPHVAGIVALMRTNAPFADPAVIRQALFDTVDPLPALNNLIATGGRVNLQKALSVDVAAPNATLNPVAPITSFGTTELFLSVEYTDGTAVKRSTIDDQDIRIDGPGGFSQIASFVSASPDADADSITAVYRIGAPGGSWNSLDNGDYTVALEPDQIADVSNILHPGGPLGTFSVDIPADPEAPQAELNNDASLIDPRVNNHVFSVTYTDNLGVNAETFDDADLQVTGPGGFAQAAKFVSFVSNPTGTQVVATYQFTAPGGTWNAADNGTYTVSLQAGEVTDINVNPVVAGSLGSFVARIDVATLPLVGSLTASPTDVKIGQQLTLTAEDVALGSSGGSVIFGRDENGNGLWERNIETAFVGSDAVGTDGYSVKVGASIFPLGTSLFFAAAENDAGEVGPASATQVRIIESQPPTLLLNAPELTTGGGTDYSFTITFTDTDAVSATTFDNNDVLVTGPHGYVQPATFVSANPGGDAAQVEVTYSISAPGQLWSGDDDGVYNISIQGNEVSDVNGNFVPGRLIGTLRVTTNAAPDPGSFPLVVGAAPGGSPHVRVIDPATDGERFSIFPDDTSLTTGVRVATADFSGDRNPDIVTALGPGGRPLVRVFNGRNGVQINSGAGSFLAYDPNFTGGLFVAAGDVNGDGQPDIITAPDAGMQPLIRIFSGVDGQRLGEFLAFGANFLGGVRVAAGDVDGDGLVEIVAARGPNSKPKVKVFNATTFTPLVSPLGRFFAFKETARNGLFVAAADMTGDELAEIIVGKDAGAKSKVKVFNAADGSVLAKFLAFDPGFTGGVRVAVMDANDDGRFDVLVGSGPGQAVAVKAFDISTLEEVKSFVAFENSPNGVFVATSVPEPIPDVVPTARRLSASTAALDEAFVGDDLLAA